jgi:hypothetical protein
MAVTPSSSTTADPSTTEPRAEQSLEDRAAGPASDVEAGETEPADSDTAAETPEGDTTADEAPAATDSADLSEADLAKLPKEIRRAVTQRFQQLAEQRKALEPYADIIKSFDTDAVGTVKGLAEQLGLEIRDPKAEAASKEQVDIAKVITDQVTEHLGPEYGDLGEKLGPAILKAVELVVAESTKPLTERHNAIVRESAQRESEAVLEAFGKKHPDWKKVEPAMVALMKKLPPGEGVTEADYLEYLHTIATADTRVADATKRVVTKMQQSASAATKAGAGVAADKVADRPSGPVSFDDAARLARQGIRLE